MELKSKFLKILNERGFIHQSTNLEALDLKLSVNKCYAYIGFDCTAPSLHVGSLIQIMILRWFQKSGHVPIVLMGGGTTKIGDPSGKDNARPILSTDEIEKNKTNIKKIFSNFLSFNGSNKAIMIDNSEWLDDINYITFLREFGSSFSINKMLTLESLKSRLDREQNLSFLEFNYPIFQAYDFLKLNDKFGCIMQFGGSDQWGNIVNGIELIRRKKNEQVFGLTSPLLTTHSGSKMGKSEKGAVWLDKNYFSDYDFWQFWRNTEDQDVVKFLKLFTELNINEIEKYNKILGSSINDVKIILANEVTKICRGEESAKISAKTAKDIFENSIINPNLPSIKVNDNQISIVDALNLLGFTKSKGDGRRLIRGKGVKINDVSLTDENFIIYNKSFKNNNIKISAGKKKYGLINFD